MDLYPAIDIRAGRVVRLSQGQADRETSYHDDPVTQAQAFAAAGSRWIHVVDLDRAFGTGDNLTIIRRIASGTEGRVRLQVGGGIRSLEALGAVLDLGVARAVLGTQAVISATFVPEAIALAGAERLAIGLDTRDGMVAIRGWVETTDLAADQICRRILSQGAKTVIYTDVSRDGMLAGPDLNGAIHLKRLGAGVIVSGGVSGLEDLVAAREAGLEGIIVGRAIYEGRFTVAEGLALLGSP